MKPRQLESSSSAGRLSSATQPPEARAAEEIASGGRSPWLQAGTIVLATRLFFSLVAYAASYLLSGDTEGLPQRDFLDLWVNWDATRFLTTAELGYEGPGSFANSYAFFPFFPLALRALGAVGVAGPLAGLLISTLACWVALAFLFKLAESDEGVGAGRRAALYLSVFPTAVFLIAPYSESLFLAGAIPAFYLARRNDWLPAALFAALAMGTSFAGVFLLLGLAAEAIRGGERSPRRAMSAAICIAVGLMPLLLYCVFLARVTGDPFYFLAEQEMGWGRSLADPLTALTNTIDRWDDPAQTTNFQLAYRIEVLAALVGIGFVIWALTKREWGYAVFMGGLLAMLLLSTEYLSVPRILLTFFPAFVFLAGVTLRRPRLHDAYLMVSTTAAAVGVIVYTRGGWFF